MHSIWNEIKKICHESTYEIIIFEGTLENGQRECEKLNISNDLVLASVVKNCNGISIDNWIRILGQGNQIRNGVLYYNTLLLDDSCLNGMFIVGNDVVGGIFAINTSKFGIDKYMVWYFAPDTLEWESLGMKYADFIAWAVQGNINEFYESMRWCTWKNDCKKIHSDFGCLIYPFLWAKECDINTATKKSVSFDELMKLNFDYSKKLFVGD